MLAAIYLKFLFKTHSINFKFVTDIVSNRELWSSSCWDLINGAKKIDYKTDVESLEHSCTHLRCKSAHITIMYTYTIIVHSFLPIIQIMYTKCIANKWMANIQTWKIIVGTKLVTITERGHLDKMFFVRMVGCPG